MASAANVADASAVPKKRSLFSKRPTWAAASQTINTGAADIFTRKNDSYEQIFEAQRRERTKSETKSRRRSEKQDSPKDVRDEDNDHWGSASKRPRISEQTYAMYGLESPVKRQSQRASADIRGTAPQPPVNQDLDGDDIIAQEQAKKMRSSNAESSTTPPRTIAAKAITRERPRESQIIALSDDEDAPTSPIVDPDDPFPELTALAHQRSKQRALETKAQQSVVTSIEPPESEFDPVIKMLVTSPLLNTKPLLVHRKLSQRLMEIRQVWCQRQGFDEEQAKQIFLTYKMMKLYDATTCRSLGIKVDSQGNVINDRPRDVFGANGDDDDNQGRVHVVAVTAEALEVLRREREDKKKIEAQAAQDKIDSQAVTSGQDIKSKGDPPEVKVRLLLKGRGYPDYKLIVRPVSDSSVRTRAA